MAESRKRFAVIGLGNIAQVAVLPAFEHAQEGCQLVALVSSDADKLAELGELYGVEHTGSYDELEEVLAEAEVDAVYITLPNTQHRAFTERCARAGVHVLCEKPMATSVEDCDAMIETCDENDVKLMIAYRLHFEPANLHAIELARSGRLGELRFFSSAFGQQVRDGDIRTRREVGGGALFDMGVYCINAARYLFRDEPVEAFGWQSDEGDSRFDGVDASTVALLRFPGDRFAQISCSQASADVDAYRLIGTQGDLRVEPAYSYHDELVHYLAVEGERTVQRFPPGDQFAPELLHFAKCIDEGVDPEPSGEEGLADVRVMQAIVESALSGRPVDLPPYERTQRPDVELEMRKPPVQKPLRTVHAPSPSR